MNHELTGHVSEEGEPSRSKCRNLGELTGIAFINWNSHRSKECVLDPK